MQVDQVLAPAGPKTESLKLEVGDVHEGELEYVARDVYVKWDDMRNKTVGTLKMAFGGFAIYPRFYISNDQSATTIEECDYSPDRLAKAIAAAFKEAGVSAIDENSVGGTLKLKRVENVPVEINGATFKANDYKAQFTPGKKPSGVSLDADDGF